MDLTRDVRLSYEQIDVLRDAARRRLRVLEKSIANDSGTYYNSLQRKYEDRDNLRQAICDLEVAQEALKRKAANQVRAGLGLPPRDDDNDL